MKLILFNFLPFTNTKPMTNDNSKRTPCQVYTRVMGYIRPVEGYNLGKKSEFYWRKYFDENKIDNSDFIRKYSTQCEQSK